MHTADKFQPTPAHTSALEAAHCHCMVPALLMLCLRNDSQEQQSVIAVLVCREAQLEGLQYCEHHRLNPSMLHGSHHAIIGSGSPVCGLYGVSFLLPQIVHAASRVCNICMLLVDGWLLIGRLAKERCWRCCRWAACTAQQRSAIIAARTFCGILVCHSVVKTAVVFQRDLVWVLHCIVMCVYDVWCRLSDGAQTSYSVKHNKASAALMLWL
ncbi:hypothetical protein COO60DRAFT_1101654 [Scenedesmus sp. NREL 46B-D3]|nr:hypothetical protein COO60DRAFT_1101654 [Scenedesmus sp. NREL 46B-D3]